MKKGKKIMLIAGIIILAMALWLAFCGYQWSWGPFTKLHDAKYPEMVALLHGIADKWDITVIDMWSDENFNAITEEQHALYMADHIHPTRAGYLEWWTPYMEPLLYAALNAQS